MSYESIFTQTFQKQIGRILHDSISNDQYKTEIISHVKSTGERIYKSDPYKFTGDILVNLVKTLIESIAEKQTAVDRKEFLTVINDYEKYILVRFTRDKLEFRQIARELNDSEDEVCRIYELARDVVNDSFAASVQGSALTPVGLLYGLDKGYRIPRTSKPHMAAETVRMPASAPQSAPGGFRRAGSLEIEPLPFTPQTPGLTYHPTNSNSLRIKGDTGQPRRTHEIRTGDNSFRYTPVGQKPVTVQKKSSTAAITILLILVAVFFVLLLALLV
ncbi:MAG: hypothetical protein K6G61_08385 [Solobacterium sp.]|nr:hypothetical protein [Solobacterium sp.]